MPTANGVVTCVNTRFRDLGAPVEHGGELNPAFVFRERPGHRVTTASPVAGSSNVLPTLPRLAARATGVLDGQTDQIDYRSSPVEVYFFDSHRAAGRSLAEARREWGRARGRILVDGNAIFLETGPVRPRFVDAIRRCVNERH